MASFLTVSGQVARSLGRGLVDPHTPLSRKAAVLGGFLGSGVRLALGTLVGRLGPRPEQPFRFWEFEADAESRAVREALSILDLDADVRPCPPGGVRFLAEVGGAHVPRLEDPNAGVTLSGARPIVEHLFARYGAGPAPRLLRVPALVAGTGVMVRALTGNRGSRARPSRAPPQPLELWSFESSPYCRLARSALSELELPYRLHNVAKGSKRRKEFVARSGKMQVPWLWDPNTGTGLFESLAIEQYLAETYGNL